MNIISSIKTLVIGMRIASRKQGVMRKTTPYVFASMLWSGASLYMFKGHGWSIEGTVFGYMLIFIAFFLLNDVQTTTNVFRDGRIHLGGVGNAIRDLARQGASFINKERREEWITISSWLIILAHLVRRELGGDRRYEYIPGLEPWEAKELGEVEGDRVQGLLLWITTYIVGLEKGQVITGNQFFVMDNNLTKIQENFGGCRRVQTAQLPLDFSVLAAYGVVVFCAAFPFVIVPTVGWQVIPVAGVVVCFLAGMLQLAYQVKDPFGNDPNDINMEAWLNGVVTAVNDIFKVKMPVKPEDKSEEATSKPA